jgi:hypothetical protein
MATAVYILGYKVSFPGEAQILTGFISYLFIVIYL